MEKIIDFAPDGRVTSLHQDAFDLGFLGAQKIERATDIRFDTTRQEWDIYVLAEAGHPEGYHWTIPSLRGFAKYDTAREFEVEWINACMLVSADWKQGTPAAMGLADQIRTRYA